MPPATSVSEKTFGREVLGSEMPVLVQFTAEHAPPLSAWDDLINDLAARVKVAKVDVDRSPALKDEYGVRGLPALLLFKYGNVIARRVGGHSTRVELEEWIDGALILALATRATSMRAAESFKLASGMEIVVVPDHRAPIVTHMVWYRAGSTDDTRGASGLAHLVAQGTFRSLDRRFAGDSTKVMARLGGVVNGKVYRDATSYWQRIPREQLKLAMEMESDRMANLRLSEEDVATERHLLVEHRRGRVDNDPTMRLAEMAHAALYRAHPHGAPPLGAVGEVAALSLDDVLDFHKRHYAPNNAAAVVLGNVSLDEVKLIASETYGKLPPNPAFAATQSFTPPIHTTARRVTLEDPRVETATFYRLFAVPGYGLAEAGEPEAIAVLAEILFGGVLSRLYGDLVVRDRVASTVSGNYFGHMGASGQLAIFVAAKDSSAGRIESTVDIAIEDIRQNGVTRAELASAKKSLVANYIYASDDHLFVSSRYARAAIAGRTVKDVEDWPAAVSRVSNADIMKFAATYLIARRSATGWLLPQQAKRHRPSATRARERRFQSR